MKILDYIEYITEKREPMTGGLLIKEREIMRKKLRKNIVTFKFQKRDGSIREANGTLHPAFLPKLKGTGAPRPPHQLVYYDLDKFGWRSFRSFKFIKIIKEEPVTEKIIDEFEKAKEEEMRRGEEEKKHHVSEKEKERHEKEREIERKEERKKHEEKKKEHEKKHEEVDKEREKKHKEHEKEREERHEEIEKKHEEKKHEHEDSH